MNEQLLILILLIFFTVITIYLSCWKAKKQIEYKGDERWNLVQLKAGNVAGHTSNGLVLVLIVLDIVSMLTDKEIMISMNRLTTIILLYIGLKNTVELFALKHFDRVFGGV